MFVSGLSLMVDTVTPTQTPVFFFKSRQNCLFLNRMEGQTSTNACCRGSPTTCYNKDYSQACTGKTNNVEKIMVADMSQYISMR